MRGGWGGGVSPSTERPTKERSIRIAAIPIHNETPYTLTEAMRQRIRAEAQEDFGEQVRAIRVQEALPRHAFNARTQEVRYAFSPQDFGFGVLRAAESDPTSQRAERVRQIDEDPETEGLPTPDDEGEDEEGMAVRTISLQSLRDDEEAQDDQEEAQDDDLFTFDDPLHAAMDDEEEEDGVELENEDDDVPW